MAGNAHLIKPLYSHWKPLNKKELNLAMRDFRVFANYHIIINKNGDAVPFVLNKAQWAVARLILSYAFATIPRPIKLVIHKSRQMGISTVLSLLDKFIAMKRPNINILHMLPDESLAKNFWIEKGEPLWEGSHPQLLPEVIATVSPMPYIRVGVFDGFNNNESMKVNLRYSGSNSKASGRSTTNQVVLLDEYAFFENVKRLEKGIIATQPKTGLSITVFVSTSNGMNHFYDVVKQAREPGSKIEHLFLPWHMLEEYERPVSKSSRLYDLDNYTPTPYDMKLFNIFEKEGYPVESWLRKIEWYDYVLDTEAKGDRDYMTSEYPSDSDESFESSGRPVLPLRVINYWVRQEHPYECITPISKSSVRSMQMTVEFEVDAKSPIRRYKKPEMGHRYFMAVDAAEGYAGDMSAGVIVDAKSMEEVCSFVVDYEQNDLAEIAVHLARYYNDAMIIPEKNMAALFIQSLQMLGYYRIYNDPNVTSKDTNKMFGIRVTVANKNEAINRLKFLMNNNIYKAHDKVFMNQAMHYAWKELPSGGYKAEAVGQDENGNPWHDDTVAARLVLMLALDFRQYKNYFNRKDNDGKKHY